MSRDTDTGGLDALFGAAEPAPAPAAPEPAPERRSRGGWLIRNALLIGIATTVTVAGFRMAEVRLPVLMIVAFFVALRLLMLAVAEVAPPPSPGPASRRGEESAAYHWAGTDVLRAAVRRWEHRLDWSQSDVDRFSRNVLPVLAELTDERLRLRHGLTMASDPRRARELIGEPLWLALSEPGRRPPKKNDLATFVEALERL